MVGSAKLPNMREATSAFKQQLGIQQAEDELFGWIAEVGLRSPLPPRWSSHLDEASGYLYYVDGARRCSSWENPLAPALRHIVEIGRAYCQDRSRHFFEEQRALLWHHHRHELDSWHGPFSDSDGRQYFVNPAKKISSWQDPRIEAQYILELQSDVLRNLEQMLDQRRPARVSKHQSKHILSGAAKTTMMLSSASALAATRSSGCCNLHGKTGQYLLTQARMTAKEDHKPMLHRMSAAAERLRGMQQDDLQAQRLNFSRKLEARRHPE